MEAIEGSFEKIFLTSMCITVSAQYFQNILKYCAWTSRMTLYKAPISNIPKIISLLYVKD